MVSLVYTNVMPLMKKSMLDAHRPPDIQGYRGLSRCVLAGLPGVNHLHDYTLKFRKKHGR